MVALDGNGIGKYMGLVKDPTFKLVGAPYPVMKAGDKPLLGQRDAFALTLMDQRPLEFSKGAHY